MEQLENEAVNGVQHPLKNPVVLDLFLTFFKSLATLEDWKNIRLVCKTWYLQSLHKWRSTAVLNLKLGPSVHQIQPENVGISTSKLSTLIENDNNSFFQFTEKPFQKYKLQNQVLDVHNVKQDSVFTTIIGPNIRHLALYEVNITTQTNTMKEIMEFLVTTIPNLERFSVNNVYIDSRRVGQPPRNITVVHPNVKVFSLRKCYAFGFANFSNLKEANLRSCLFGDDIAYLVDSNPDWGGMDDILTNSSITRLNLEDCNMLSNKFARVRFTALMHLSVDRYTGDSNDLSILSRFLEKHQRTLKTLELFGSFTKRPESYCLNVNLPALTEVRACGNVFSDLIIIRSAKNLQVLHLDLYGFEKQEKMKNEISVKETDFGTKRKFLTKWNLIENSSFNALHGEILAPYLHYLQINYELLRRNLETVAIWMPNLKTLKTVLNKNTFGVVCENWPRLEHLECMFGSKITNENITGAETGTSDGQHRKALVDMECLSTFKLHTECNKSLLSDDSVAKGFLRVPKLTDLSICVSSDFSHDAEILLGCGIQNAQVIRNYSSNPLHNNWQCCRDTEYQNFISTLKEFSTGS